ncbi:hypothetical protein JTB14_001135 [Gonioctena quinquepunctata]|nr:hypothetical protein JTB14_001135 [Gonioctena quinquepunctata]
MRHTISVPATSMWSKSILVLVALTVVCLALPRRRFVDCNRPLDHNHLNRDILERYIEQCVKSLISDQRYGKRSLLNGRTLIEKLQPSFYLDRIPSEAGENIQNPQQFYESLAEVSN